MGGRGLLQGDLTSPSGVVGGKEDAPRRGSRSLDHRWPKLNPWSAWLLKATGHPDGLQPTASLPQKRQERSDSLGEKQDFL